MPPCFTLHLAVKRSHQILGNHPAIKLLLVQLWIMVVSIILLEATPEDNSFEDDLNDLEQAEESTVVIPSLPTVQEIT